MLIPHSFESKKFSYHYLKPKKVYIFSTKGVIEEIKDIDFITFLKDNDYLKIMKKCLSVN